MKYLSLFLDTLTELAHHKLRTLLTLLGMIFGVGAVIAMLNIGEGAEREALKIINTMGLHNLIVESKDFEEKELKEQRKHSQVYRSEMVKSALLHCHSLRSLVLRKH